MNTFLYRVIYSTIRPRPGGMRPAKVREICEYPCETLPEAEIQANLIASTLSDIHLTDVQCAWMSDGPMNKTTIMVDQLSHYEIEYSREPVTPLVHQT